MSEHNYAHIKKKRFLTSEFFNDTENCSGAANSSEPQTHMQCEISDTVQLNVTTEPINADIVGMLQQVLKNQASLQEQLQHVEQLCQHRNTGNQSNILEKMMTENLVILKLTYKSTRRLFGENLSQLEEEMGSFLPLYTTKEVETLESKLQSKENEDAMRTFLVSSKQNRDVLDMIKFCITDSCLTQYNWDGRCNKSALNQLKLFGTILKDLFPQMDSKSYEKEARGAIGLSHNRSKHKRKNTNLNRDETVIRNSKKN